MKFRGKEKTVFLMSFVLPFLLMMLIMAVLHITPFGDNTFLYDDMKRQYIDFYAYYRNVWHGQDSFLYSFSNGLGGNMTGFCAYYLMSPLLIPFIFLPQSCFPAAISFLIAFKCAFCGLTCCLFPRSFCQIEEESGRLSALPVFSTSYALSGYMMANLTNTMWIDAVAMLPLLLLTCDRMLDAPVQKRRRTAAYILCTAVTVCLNYYIAYMILLFLTLRVLLQKPGVRKLLYWLAATVSGMLLDSFLIFPTFMSLRESAKNSVQEGVCCSGTFHNPFSVLTKLFSMGYDADQVMNGLPNIFCGTLLLLPFLLYFGNALIPKAERVRMRRLVLLLILSFVFEPLNLLWHAGTEPLGYLYRYSFLAAFLMVTCACRCWYERKGVSAGMLRICTLGTVLICVAAYACRQQFMDGRK